MPLQGRSADDLPLAAYSTGVDPATEPPEIEAALAAPVAAAPDLTVPAGPVIDDAASFPVPEDEPQPPVPNVLATKARALAKRQPRVVAGAAFVVVIVVGVSMLLGGKGPSVANASATPSAPAIVVVAAEPGIATLVLTGSVKGTFSMTGTSEQPVSGNIVGATWSDPLQNVLTLNGNVDRGTRATDAQLVLTWSLQVDGKLLTFTSKAGECTIGMAQNPKNVSGSFACPKLKSDDGKLTVEASGTYRT